VRRKALRSITARLSAKLGWAATSTPLLSVVCPSFEETAISARALMGEAARIIASAKVTVRLGGLLRPGLDTGAKQ
jgi:hypothetical protein